jgi:hypothetical protein
MEQLQHKKEARKWSQRADDEDDVARTARIELRAEADKYLKLVEESLKGTQEIEHLFTIRWKITP